MFIVTGCFLLAFLSVFIARYIQVRNIPPFEPLPSEFTLQPPAQALTGELTVTKGHAEIFKRIADNFSEASSGAKILTGESVYTRTNSTARVEVKELVEVYFNPGSEVAFVNLFKENALLQQKSGTVHYNLNSIYPVSVRTLHLLSTVYEGSATITVDSPEITVNIPKGRGKIAFVDTDNNTQILELSSGQKALINDITRKAELL